jgi:hypothetical protein
MANLRLAEAGILHQFINDPSGRSALEEFFRSRAEYHKVRCVEYMLTRQKELAEEHAFQSNAFARGFAELEQFVKTQLQQAT